ncbi:MAG: uridine kinase [Oscillospiraceae bacterium]|nr:uridine kinase [Oscillospiraceae bacterium]
MYCKILKDINNLLDNSSKDVILVAIDGPSASGKSSLGKFINDNFVCNVFHMDDFFLPFDRKTEERLSQPGGNIDYERVEEELISKILKPECFTFNVYDCHTLSLFESGKVFHKRLNIIEGVYSLHPQLSKYFDYKIYLDVDSKKQCERILERSGEKKLERYKKEWIPLENRYFDTFDIKESCDVVFDTTELF